MGNASHSVFFLNKLPFNGLSNPHKCYKPVCFTSSPHTCLRALGTRPRLRLSSLRCGAPRWRRISPETPWTSCRATMPRRSAVPRSASLACSAMGVSTQMQELCFFLMWPPVSAADHGGTRAPRPMTAVQGGQSVTYRRLRDFRPVCAQAA